MNWTSRTPIDSAKCIVETESGCVFPAHCINGTWWNTEKGFVIEGVKRWIIYPEGEEPNDYVAPEVLLKYVMQAYRNDHSKLEATRDLNRKLCSTYGKVKDENTKLKERNSKLKTELKKYREQAQKLKSMFDRFSALFGKVSRIELEPEDENQKEEEIVA